MLRRTDRAARGKKRTGSSHVQLCLTMSAVIVCSKAIPISLNISAAAFCTHSLPAPMMLIRYHPSPAGVLSHRVIIGEPSSTVQPSASMRAVCGCWLNCSAACISSGLPNSSRLRAVIGTRIVFEYPVLPVSILVIEAIPSEIDTAVVWSVSACLPSINSFIMVYWCW